MGCCRFPLPSPWPRPGPARPLGGGGLPGTARPPGPGGTRPGGGRTGLAPGGSLPAEEFAPLGEIGFVVSPLGEIGFVVSPLGELTGDSGDGGGRDPLKGIGLTGGPGSCFFTGGAGGACCIGSCFCLIIGERVFTIKLFLTSSSKVE